jgi:two-component sensor histidine kinase
MIGTRIEISGPALLIPAPAAQALGMALHELATNAGKYGALSNETGRIALHWSIGSSKGGRKTFLISWRERGAPAVTAPAQRGFGSTVLCRTVKESLNAQVELEFAPVGVNWRLQCTASEIMEGSGSGAARSFLPARRFTHLDRGAARPG